MFVYPLFSPARGCPVGTLLFGKESPSHKTSVFLPLSHIYSTLFGGTGFAQGFINIVEVFFFRNNGGKPVALLGNINTFGNHVANKQSFAAVAPQFGTLSAKV